MEKKLLQASKTRVWHVHEQAPTASWTTVLGPSHVFSLCSSQTQMQLEMQPGRFQSKWKAWEKRDHQKLHTESKRRVCSSVLESLPLGEGIGSLRPAWVT